MTLIRRPSLLSELESLRDVTDRFFDERRWRPLWAVEGEHEAIPALDLYSTPEAVVAKVALPGVKPGDVEVTIDGDFVTVRGSYSAQREVGEAGYVQRELERGDFRRRFGVPTPVKADEARATFADGLLTITLPKAEGAAAHHIKVDVESAAEMADIGSPGGPQVLRR